MTPAYWTDIGLETEPCPHCHRKGLVTNGARIACHACGWERTWKSWMKAIEKRVYRK